MASNRPDPVTAQWCCHSLSVFLIPVALFVCSGCGEEPTGRMAVSGEVTDGGQPVKAGRVSLIPEEGTKGSAAGAEIFNGRFVIAAERGLLPGKYRAQVIVSDPEESSKSESRPPTKEEILSGTREVTLDTPGFEDTESLDDNGSGTGPEPIPEFPVEVKNEGPNQFTFEIQ